MIQSKAPVITRTETSAGRFLAFDMDVSLFDNCKTQKEGGSRTYKGYDEYTPIFAYLGTEGYLVNLELREDRQQCQKNTPQFIGKTLGYVHEPTVLTENPCQSTLITPP